MYLENDYGTWYMVRVLRTTKLMTVTLNELSKLLYKLEDYVQK